MNRSTELKKETRGTPPAQIMSMDVGEFAIINTLKRTPKPYANQNLSYPV
jgi:hypothetical protein